MTPLATDERPSSIGGSVPSSDIVMSRKEQLGMSNGKLGAHLYHAVGWQAKVARCVVAESREMHK